jgi:hypothetical protein
MNQTMKYRLSLSSDDLAMLVIRLITAIEHKPILFYKRISNSTFASTGRTSYPANIGKIVSGRSIVHGHIFSPVV